MKSIVVTGTSTGIGWGGAKVLIAKGFRVFGSVRKEADAERLQKEFGANFVPLLFDVTDAAAVSPRARRSVANALGGETLAGLVNNAGVAVAGPLLYYQGRRISRADRGQSDRPVDRDAGVRAAAGR